MAFTRHTKEGDELASLRALTRQLLVEEVARRARKEEVFDSAHDADFATAQQQKKDLQENGADELASLRSSQNGKSPRKNQRSPRSAEDRLVLDCSDVNPVWAFKQFAGKRLQPTVDVYADLKGQEADEGDSGSARPLRATGSSQGTRLYPSGLPSRRLQFETPLQRYQRLRREVPEAVEAILVWVNERQSGGAAGEQGDAADKGAIGLVQDNLQLQGHVRKLEEEVPKLLQALQSTTAQEPALPSPKRETDGVSASERLLIDSLCWSQATTALARENPLKLLQHHIKSLDSAPLQPDLQTEVVAPSASKGQVTYAAEDVSSVSNLNAMALAQKMQRLEQKIAALSECTAGSEDDTAEAKGAQLDTAHSAASIIGAVSELVSRVRLCGDEKALSELECSLHVVSTELDLLESQAARERHMFDSLPASMNPIKKFEKLYDELAPMDAIADRLQGVISGLQEGSIQEGLGEASSVCQSLRRQEIQNMQLKDSLKTNSDAIAKMQLTLSENAAAVHRGVEALIKRSQEVKS
ncbi:unnamed protein product [Vitrella brassicaformis CCMP3155]|uniref:Uncharacterized protein n=1 Tax=Vitrella brassicaformis (strain CCMP3155) TaxID=1169540 RepID=A0A0G4FG05_VITBC|nr:unnamed protein product [Vitrella brassicaformis CCMP3155]|eukprot:CEM12175.1 unnamed protein product [Vitrella brassicaformis CCMP3155]